MTARAGRREWLALIVLALPCVVYAMDLTVLNLALPALSADLHPTGTQLLWIVDVYGFMVAGALITMGALGDRIGARRLLLIGAAAFGGASLLAAFATSPATLIGARALLGLAGATIAPSTLSLIRVLFEDPRQRTAAIAVWVTSYSAGGAIGPLAGGALLNTFWWGSVFLLALPVMALLLVLGPRLLPEDTAAQAGRLDLISAGLSLAAVLSAVYGLKQLVVMGPGTAAVVSLALGFALGGAFVRRQLTLSDPIIDLRLLRRPAFGAALGTNLFAFFVIFGMSLFVTQYLQSVLGLSPLQAGLWSVPQALGFIVGSTVTPRISTRLGTVVTITAGLVIGAVGYLIMAGAQGLTTIIAGGTIGALGLAAVITLAADAAVAAVPPERAGVASATAETSSELGGALGIAVLGSIGAAVYRAQVAASLPPQLGHAARETIGGALAAAQRLPTPLEHQVISAAHDAFGHALTVTASIGGVLLLATAIGARTLLTRNPEPTAGPGAADSPSASDIQHPAPEPA